MQTVISSVTKLNPTPRDVAVLEFIGRNGVATLGQLHRTFWQNAGREVCQSRLVRLEKAGYLSDTYLGYRTPQFNRYFAPGERLFFLTERGVRTSAESDNLMVASPNEGELVQQIMVQEFYLWLQKRCHHKRELLLHWYNERELRSQFASAKRFRRQPNFELDIPDARFRLLDSTGNIAEYAVEVDGQYSGAMLRQKVTVLNETDGKSYWVTLPCRAERIRQELSAAGAYMSDIEIVALPENGK
jgi:hypothetical protein